MSRARRKAPGPQACSSSHWPPLKSKVDVRRPLTSRIPAAYLRPSQKQSQDLLGVHGAKHRAPAHTRPYVDRARSALPWRSLTFPCQQCESRSRAIRIRFKF
ncbi:hypothetical protein D9611_012092 [Ephemerocybe angulata]|uniref:Uncharacterized protein n=1 Tax=Ephemerocybe angulata TaxID=980116 RepID=A0A8H5AT21_9AGAR|nr:hypothetical protein D9611_012092 [Tulosesus angulatus]